MINFQLEKIINNYLKNNLFQDYTPNGLQVEGKKEIKNIAIGVTICQELIDKAIELKSDAIIVHHGIFWNNDTLMIHGIKRLRLKKLLINNINLYSWHLPLDTHECCGNNYILGKKLNIGVIKKINPFVFYGDLKNYLTKNELKIFIKKKLNRSPFVYSSKKAKKYIKKIAWCTGKGQNFVDLLYKFKEIDAFITGEVSEQTIHSIKEQKIHFFSAGHYATEIYGVIELGKWLTKNYDFSVNFIDIDNPI